MADPDWGDVIHRYATTIEVAKNHEMPYLALGSLGATVLPHNPYLHSAMVQTRDYGGNLAKRRQAVNYDAIDSTLDLMFALFIDVAILILAAAAFNKVGMAEVVEIEQAQEILGPLLGAAIAPRLVAIALFACGLMSTITATLAGQAVTEASGKSVWHSGCAA